MTVIPARTKEADAALEKLRKDLVSDGHSRWDLGKLALNLATGLPDEQKAEMTRRLNENPEAVCAEARKKLKENPKLLNEVNDNPMKIVDLMKAAPKITPAATVATVSTNSAAEPSVTPSKVEPKPVSTGASTSSSPATASPVAVAAKPFVKSEEVLLMEELEKREGFKELKTSIDNNPTLEKALMAMYGDGKAEPKSMMDTLKQLKKSVDQDPQFFKKANQSIDAIPKQMRESVFTQMAENPAVAKAAMNGDGMAKMQIFGGALMGGGLKDLFGDAFSGGRGGFGDFKNMMTKIMEVIKDVIGKITGGGLGKLVEAPAVQNLGTGEMLRKTAATLDQTLGTDVGNKPAFDANDPHATVRTVASVGQPQPASNDPTYQLQLQAGVAPTNTGRDAQNDPYFKKMANGPSFGGPTQST